MSCVRLGKCDHPNPPGRCKMFRVMVKFVTKHKVFFSHKFNFCPILAFFGVKGMGNVRNDMFKVFFVK